MYKKIVLRLLIFTLSTVICGCASMTHFNKERSAGDKKAFFVDAKQRGVYSVKKTKGTGATAVSWEGICAEPAPDAISSLAASLGVDLTLTDKGKLGVSQSISEAAGSIGIRTAAIEALRDIMYRNCEAYALGGISDIGIETLQRRFQSTMVAILAIEQLTGAVRAPAIILTGSSSTGSADAIVDLTTKTELARKSLDDAKSAEAKPKEKYDVAVGAKKVTEKKLADGKAEADRIKALPTPSDSEKKTLADYDELAKILVKNTDAEAAAKKEYDAAQETTKGREQAYSALDASRAAALTAGGKSSASGQFETLRTTPQLSDSAVKDVAKAVENIVGMTINMSLGNEMCVTLLGQHPEVSPAENSALAICRDRLRDSKGEFLRVQ